MTTTITTPSASEATKKLSCAAGCGLTVAAPESTQDWTCVACEAATRLGLRAPPSAAPSTLGTSSAKPAVKARPTSRSNAYRESIRLLQQLVRLTENGRSQSPEAQRIRAAMEAPWYTMSEEEQDLVEALSADLRAPEDQENPLQSVQAQTPTAILIGGPHSGGKTTLARLIADRYQIPLLSEVVRGVLASRETTLPRLSANLDEMNAFQRAVYERQLIEERARQGTPFVSDRGPDNLAYAVLQAEWGVGSDLLNDERTTRYMASLREHAIVFVVEPKEELLTADGTRHHVDWPTVLRVDGMIRMLLHQHRVPFVPLSCLLLSQRMQVVDAVLAGKLQRMK